MFKGKNPGAHGAKGFETMRTFHGKEFAAEI